jgi:hypothetical protein
MHVRMNGLLSRAGGLYLSIAVALLVYIGSLWLVYDHTRNAYRSVGFNDGQISQRQLTIEQIERTVSVGDCRQLDRTSEIIEVVAVKADTVYLVRTDKGCLQFCRDGRTAEGR